MRAIGCDSSLYPFWGISPKGARHNSPGHRPGRKNEFRSSPERAVQARRTHISPFQGWLPARFKPRAMPWAKVFLPFRQIQPSSQRGYKLESYPFRAAPPVAFKSMFKISCFGPKWRLLTLGYGFFSVNSAAINLKKPFAQNQNPSI